MLFEPLRKSIIRPLLAFCLCIAPVIAHAQSDQQQAPQQTQQQPDANAPQGPVQPAGQPESNPPQVPVQPVEPTTDSGNGGNRQLPAPAGRGLFGGESQDTAPAAETPLTGAETYGLGSPTGVHNLFDAAVHLSAGADRTIAPGQTSFAGLAGGTIDLNRSWSRYLFTAQYAGGGTFYTPASGVNTVFQDVAAMQTVRWRRTTLRLRDDFIQSSGAFFGSLGVGGPGLTLPGGLVGGLQQTFVPQESIFTGTVESLNNSALAELDYDLSRRSTLTLAGSFGLLHYLGSGFIDDQDVIGHIGYGYQLSRKNTIGSYYDFSHYSFTGGISAIDTHYAQIAFGRRVTGRTAIQISAGPSYLLVAGLHQWSWSVSASLAHQVRRTTYSAAYSRGVTNGSGVLLGAQTQTATASVSTALSPTWSGVITGGYAFNSSLPTPAATAGFFQYQNWFASANVGRLWRRLIRTGFYYEAQRQIQPAGSCPVASCGPTSLLQVAGVTVDFHIRPVAIR